MRENYNSFLKEGDVCSLQDLCKLDTNSFFEALQESHADKKIAVGMYCSFINFLWWHRTKLTAENQLKFDEAEKQSKLLEAPLKQEKAEAWHKLVEAEEQRLLEGEEARRKREETEAQRKLMESEQRRVERKLRLRNQRFAQWQLREPANPDASVIQKAEVLKDHESATNASMGYGSPRGP